MAEIERADSVVTVIPSGDVVAERVNELRDDLDGVLDEASEVVLDMSDVSIIDSSGIGVLISTQNKLKKKSGTLRVIKASEDIYKMFVIMRLDKHFEVQQA